MTTIPRAPASCSSRRDIREVNGVRFHLTMKSSTEESTRLMAAVLQQQLRQVGIALDIRTFEFATFFSDVTHGLFQLYSLRWIGGNEDPDIFEYVFHSSKFPPNGANRGYFADPRVDALIDQARHELDQNTRKQLYAEIQRTLADELPYINLWYFDNVLVHSKRVRNLTLNPSGNYDFLKTAELDGVVSRRSSVVSKCRSPMTDDRRPTTVSRVLPSKHISHHAHSLHRRHFWPSRTQHRQGPPARTGEGPRHRSGHRQR